MQLSTICKACGKSRRYTNLLYHPETLDPFCAEPYLCSLEHPNAPHNVQERGQKINLVPSGEASKYLRAQLSRMVDEGRLSAMEKFVHQHTGKPLAFKFFDPQVVARIGRYMNCRPGIRLSDALRELVMMGLKQWESGNGMDEHVEMQPAPAPAPTPAPAPAPTPEPEPEAEDDENDLVF